MLVYRIQDLQGRGPFKPGFSHRWVEDREDHENLIPWPVQFPHILRNLKYYKHVACSCETVEQLKRWFNPNEYRRLQIYGYEAVTMQVDQILGRSDIQCVIERRRPLRENVVGFQLYPD